MDDKWSVKVYESPSGEQPVEKFIKAQNERARLKIARMFDHVEEFGLEGAYSYAKKLTGTSIWELRILGADSIRIFYVTITGKIFLLLHGFVKKTQKTPAKEISLAQKRLEEFRLRGIKR
ncbi:MAG: hypothetical protein A2782_00675 [Candidatus Blackburnbacteria bacterium RIFCSPHIGHO2_01_FULL_43_15b]|uniref:Addiction module toxin RelE n=1 Tax=Candidatus Blackburnbacteria bacterium RIFCSPHIGHO2_01_FULL_43_15b TaxID=1797513 RepID=A0A1G1UZ18_9BACT|nr:MAG: hypothetical protein A2782_00675 [Candidatus Blackburnbacteria bacterium RIFCSPHIGHO2_01_FULL_43_15b]